MRLFITRKSPRTLLTSMLISSIRACSDLMSERNSSCMASILASNLVPSASIRSSTVSMVGLVLRLSLLIGLVWNGRGALSMVAEINPVRVTWSALIAALQPNARADF